jgi:hypothetical protein
LPTGAARWLHPGAFALIIWHFPAWRGMEVSLVYIAGWLLEWESDEPATRVIPKLDSPTGTY